MFTSMQPPLTRAEFEERMNYAVEQSRMGLVHFARGLRSIDGMLYVRHLPNGRIDLLSIDESARLHANMCHQMRDGDFAGVSADNAEDE